MRAASIDEQSDPGAGEIAALLAPSGAPADIAKLVAEEGLEVVVFDGADALLAQADTLAIALIVLCMGDSPDPVNGLVERLTRQFTQTPLVVVGPRIQPRAARAILAAGGVGVVLHEDLEHALGPCLQAVLAGQVCLPRRDWRQIEPPVLSSREKQVLGLVVMGHTNSQIAQRLFLAESTVKSHLSSSFNKLGVCSRHEAVARILDPRAGLGVGILALGGEPLSAVSSV